MRLQMPPGCKSHSADLGRLGEPSSPFETSAGDQPIHLNIGAEVAAKARVFLSFPLRAAFILCLPLASFAQTVTIDSSPAGRQQTIDGFGTFLSSPDAQPGWWEQLYFDDLRASIGRMDLTPAFKSPYSDFTCNSPWFQPNPALPGPDGNNVRTYTNATDYTRLFAGNHAAIAVMGPSINDNVLLFDFNNSGVKTAGQLVQQAMAKLDQLGDFKLYASIWSPPPWLKISSGNSIGNMDWPLPANNPPWPFVWAGNYAGGMLDTSGTPRAEFFDGIEATSALTQFARYLAAYLRGVQNTYGVKFYAISIQNELNFEEFYNSCTYPLSSGYLAALMAARAELDKYPDLAGIKIVGPEDLLGGDAYALWQYGGGGSPIIHKNLQYLQNVAANPIAAQAISFFCIHGYAPDGVTSAGTNPQSWDWWARGWTSSPAAGIPPNVSGFTAYQKKSWMTETSGEDPVWLSPATGFPNNGGFSLALKIHQALTTGRESAWLHWQFGDTNPAGTQTLADSTQLANSPKYVGVKHFFRYIRPDAVRVTANVAGSTTLNASAFVHDAEKTLVIVLVNSAASAQAASIPVPVFPPGLNSFATYTSQDGSYFQAGSVSVSGGSISVNVPAYGVMTLRGFGTGGGDNFATWIANYFATAPNNTATSNPSGDGVVNLLKFAFNLAPNQPNSALLTAGTGLAGLPLIRVENLGGLRFTIEYIRRKGAGLSYQVQSSHDLHTWVPADVTPVGSPTRIDSVWERVKVQRSQPIAAGADEFLRVQVSSP
jgi:O-glycosyl hydrolase